MALVCAAQWLVSLPLANHLVRRELGGSRVLCMPALAGAGARSPSPSKGTNVARPDAAGGASGGGVLAHACTPRALLLSVLSVCVGYTLFSLQNSLVTYMQARSRAARRVRALERGACGLAYTRSARPALSFPAPPCPTPARTLP